jgi:pyruvate ferredoxin oxidoreductase gamma subunit/phenylglyoxylate dehydrogenase gamma subunit
MYEIRLHGRGGQGAVLAANLLARAFVEEGRHVVAIPSFGFERRGAPVACYLRFDGRPIRQMTNIYTPDCIIAIDPTVGRAVDIFQGIKPEATLVQATRSAPAELAVPPRVSLVGTCNAVALALQIFGKPITNTIMLGAFARATGLVRLASLENAVRSESGFRDASLTQNLEALKRGYDATQSQRMKLECVS